MPADQEAATLTVIYPAVDTRGPFTERLQTWTRQTVDRSSYRIAVMFSNVTPAERAAAAELLSEGDAILTLDDAIDAALWNEGASKADTTWLVLTEGHSLAKPDCLAAVQRWIASRPAAVAGNFAIEHPSTYRMAQLSDRWFATILDRWAAPGTWRRLHRAGFVIRADVFKALGGYDARLGQFAIHLFAARLDASGHAVDRVPGAAVIHLDDTGMDDHHFDTIDFVRGECVARAEVDPAFFERYFGHDPVFADQLAFHPVMSRRMLQALAVAGRRAPSQLPWLVRRAAGLFAGTAFGSVRRAVRRLSIALDECAVMHLPLPLPARWRWHCFNRAHANVVAQTRIEWAEARVQSPISQPTWQQLEAARITPSVLVGMHGLESLDGDQFRWTEPVLLVRAPPADVDRVLVLETLGTRGDIGQCILAVVVDGRPLRHETLASGARQLIVPLPPSPAGATATEVAIVCRPLVPARHGNLDRRRLGLPIRALRVWSRTAASEQSQARGELAYA